MKELAPAHGGGKLINRIVAEGEKDKFLKEAGKLKTYTISNGDISVFYRIADGTLSPLEGPMDEKEFNQVLEKEYIERNGEKFAWTIPIAFAVSKEDKESFNIGEKVSVKTEKGKIIGILEISSIYYFDKLKYNKSVYGTEREHHPGPRIFNEDPREYLLGGKIKALPQIEHFSYGKYILSPLETRKLVKEKEWQRIVAFQTRNPLHRAHEYTMVYAMEKLTKEGFFTGVVLNPLVGATKDDDIPADIRMKTYEALIDDKLIGAGDKDIEFWKTKNYDLSDELLLIGLDMRMFYAGPKEAVMHAIYRQNLGFTDIIIGRKHADAHFDDGTPAWGDFDAQEKFDKLKGKLSIKPLRVGFAAYFEEIARVGLVDEFKKKGYHQISISGKELRKKLEDQEPVDERIMRPPVAQILRDFYKKKMAKEIKATNIVWHDTDISKEDREKREGHKGTVIWLTGMPSSGKSTIAVELQAILFEKGCNVFILDGDNIRHGLNKNLGFSPEDREENIRRIGEVAKLFAEAGFFTITSFISPYRNDRDAARALLEKGEFIEVYVKASLKSCEQRDPKGLYKKARSGQIKEFTGVSAPYEEPLKPEIAIDTEKYNKEECAQQIVKYLLDKGYIFKNLEG